MHEIVTLQLGKQSNYIGTHFWNIQESYFTYSGEQESPVNHDVHFRPGRAYDGTDTFTPRVVIYDFKREFGALKKINDLYDALGEPTQTSAWGGKTATQRNPVIEEHDYQRQLNEGIQPGILSPEKVRFWSDYNRVFYHPRSMVQIYETDLGPEQRAFNTWEAGEELYHSLDRDEDLFERDLRPFVEECDQMQGLQVMTSVDDGWSGFASKYIDRLRDEFGKGTIWVVASQEASVPQQQQTVIGKLVNEARSLLEISPQASVYIPMVGAAAELPKSINLDRTSLWCTSALQSTALETMTLPTRLRYMTSSVGVVSLEQLAFVLQGGESRNIVQLDLSLERISSAQVPVVDARISDTVTAAIGGGVDWCTFLPRFSPDAEDESSIYSRLEMIRGGSDDPTAMAGTSRDGPGPRVERFHSELSFPMLDSFPQIYLDDSEGATVRTSLTTSAGLGKWVKELELKTKWRIGRDERENFSNGLLEIGERYKSEHDYSDDEEGWDD